MSRQTTRRAARNTTHSDKDPITPVTGPTRITVPSSSEYGYNKDDYERMPPVVESSVSNSRSLSQEIAEVSLLEESVPAVEDPDLDSLWETLRTKKEKKMAKERPKVQSLQEPEEFSQIDPPDIDIPLESPRPEQKQIRKQKSVTSFRESADGRTLVTFVDVRGCEKHDVHVSYQRHRLVISWQNAEYSEWEEDGCIVRERLVNNFQRTFPLPEGTRFEEIRCAMNGRHLVLKYPNSRAFRVENVTMDSRGSVRS
ncbi:hypothetical protein VNI00_005052 [Paramarasmius palmivorus]|uniref:SHSP domain-containing protein n=1 Tax=Paramarasmius palmivorus TaxID=297713 RepID=A0AAW0DH35_9AGAR